MYACPFNTGTDFPNSEQPCLYTVRVVEVFKGNYSVRGGIETVGLEIEWSISLGGGRQECGNWSGYGVGR